MVRLSEIMNLTDLCPGQSYNMYLVHFDEGLLGIPKRVSFKGIHAGRPVLKHHNTTVTVKNAAEDFGEQHERDWLVVTASGEMRTVKFSDVAVNLHLHLLPLSLLKQGYVYTMFCLKHDTDWDIERVRIVSFRGWTVLPSSDTPMPELQPCGSRYRFSLHQDRLNARPSPPWLTDEGEAVLFAPSEMHVLPKAYWKLTKEHILQALGSNDEIKVGAKLKLETLPVGKAQVQVETCLQDPITLQRPPLQKAVYLTTDVMRGNAIQCLYELQSLLELIDRDMQVSPCTRKPFTAKDIARLAPDTTVA